MSIVGTEAVSMRDLMKLGPQTLGAMAQGQMKSIAPSYMVIAALKALTDEQKGMMSQVPEQTVKDQVVAQAAPPAQAGLGAMMPQKNFAEGGSVQDRPLSFAEQLGNWFSTFGSGIGQDIADLGRGKFRRRTEEEQNYGNEGHKRDVPSGTQATTSTGEGRARLAETPNLPIQDLQQPTGKVSVSSATARSGLGGMSSPLGKYEKEPNATPSAASFPLDIPVNQQLADAAKKFGSPDEKRMAELKEAERNAGLGAFAKGILQGNGFGGSFGPAVADYFSAQNAQAEKRRAYEDQREAVATELGIKQGEQARQDFLTKTKYGDERSDKAREQEMERFKAANQVIHFGNQDALEQAKIDMMSEAHKLQLELRKDGLDRQKFEKLLALQQGATKVAQDYVDGYVKANPILAAKTDDPVVQRKIQDMRETEYRRLFPVELEMIMHTGLGVPAVQNGAGSGKVYRGEMK